MFYCKELNIFAIIFPIGQKQYLLSKFGICVKPAKLVLIFIHWLLFIEHSVNAMESRVSFQALNIVLILFIVLFDNFVHMNYKYSYNNSKSYALIERRI
jgi:hypothetical protein